MRAVRGAAGIIFSESLPDSNADIFPAYKNTGLCLRLSAARSDVSNYPSMPILREGPWEYTTQDLPRVLRVRDPGEGT